MTLHSRGLTSFHHFEGRSWLLECNERLYCTRASGRLRKLPRSLPEGQSSSLYEVRTLLSPDYVSRYVT